MAGHLVYLKPVEGTDYFFYSAGLRGPEDKILMFPHNGKVALGFSYKNLGEIQEPNMELI